MMSESTKALSSCIVVCCHGTPTLSEGGAIRWLLKPFQCGEELQLEEQAAVGVRLAAKDAPHSLLVFSGGNTAQAGSEAAGYLAMCRQRKWFGYKGVEAFATSENYARDSFENILYSICRFRQVVGKYPKRFKVVSWGFKYERFEMHRRALRIPDGAWDFHGVGKPIDPAAATLGECLARVAWSCDPLGNGQTLKGKREQRSRISHREAYASSCPELSGLLLSQSHEYHGRLPWDG